MAADGLERQNEGRLKIELGPLREGASFVYDMDYTSLLHGVDTTLPGAYEIHVGTKEQRSFGGGPIWIIPIEYRIRTPPWRAMVGEVEERHGTIYLDAETGGLVEQERVVLEKDHQQDDDGRWTATETRSSATSRPRHEADAVHLPILGGVVDPQECFTYGKRPAQVALWLLGFCSEAVETGKLDGVPVYRAAIDVGTGYPESFACLVPQPLILYRDIEGFAAFAGRNLTHDGEGQVWVRPGAALPARSSCTSEYRDGDQLVEAVRVVLTLTRHEPGQGDAFVLPRCCTALAPYERVPPRPTLLPGLPVQGKAPLLFPAADAVAILRDAEALDGFRAVTEPPFAVASFDYREREYAPKPPHVEPLTPVPDPTGLLSDADLPGEPVLETLWHFVLVNPEGERRRAYLIREMDAIGQTVNESLQVTPLGAARHPIPWEQVPHSLVPMDRLLEAWEKTTGAPWASWSLRSIGSQGGSVYVDDERKPRWLASVRHSGATNRGDVVGWASYDAETGRLVAREQYDLERTTGAPRPQSLNAAAPVEIAPYATISAWATVSAILVTLGFALAYFSDHVARLSFGMFYAKIHKDRLLEHGTRETIVAFVTANPGATTGAIRQHAGIGHGTAIHHLGALERNGVLVSRRVGRRRCHFLAGSAGPSDMVAIAAARTKAANRLLTAVQANPGLNQYELAECLGVTRPAVRFQAKRLEAHGALRVERHGREVRYHPSGPHPA